ncbi:MAG: carbohydrate ABC transporter permease, partial [Thermotogaceae bacterium]|nr:carbohydrate ABC transporter permease [Thermotogaceae bacterium]
MEREFKLTFFQKNSEKILNTVIFIILIVVTLPIILGYLWLIIRSFSVDVVRGFIPTQFTLKNWRFLWETMEGYPNIWRATLNTLWVA